MKNKNVPGRVLRRQLLIANAFLGLLIYSCEPIDNRLGEDVLPPADSISAFSDTLYNLGTMMVTPAPIVTSISADNASPGRVFLLGSRVDTVTGLSRAEIVTQLTITQAGIFGDDPQVDSLEFSMYVAGMEGDTSLDFRLRVHEFTGRLEYDSVYYSDYDITGKFDPEPLVEMNFKPVAGVRNTFYIRDQEFLDRIIAAAQDTVFESDSLVKENFRGLYITAEQFSEGGAFAKIQLNSNFTRLGFRYLHDSVDADTASYLDYDRYYMNFEERFTQSLNIFHHDRSGSAVESFIDQPASTSKISYLQGMTGVNVRISFPGELLDLAEQGPVSVNAAKLILPVVPDSISGIDRDDFPPYLMLSNIMEDGTTRVVYDYLVNPESATFGKLSRTFDVSAFVDPVYYYYFNIGMHVQSILNGDIPIGESDLLLFIRNPYLTSRNMKLWSNQAGPDKGLKLELIYSKF